MGEFRFDEKGNVRYEASNLADAAIMFTGDWDAALAQLPEVNDTDAAIRAGTFLITPTQRLLEQPVGDREKLDAASRSLGEAMAQGIVDGRERALSGGQPPSPPDHPDDEDEGSDGDDEPDRLQRVFELFIWAALAYLAVHVIVWIVR